MSGQLSRRSCAGVGRGQKGTCTLLTYSSQARPRNKYPSRPSQHLRSVSRATSTAPRTTFALASRPTTLRNRVPRIPSVIAVAYGLLRPRFVATFATMPEGSKWTGPVVRKTFLDFFANKAHTIGMLVYCLWASIFHADHLLSQFPRALSFLSMIPPCSSPSRPPHGRYLG